MKTRIILMISVLFLLVSDGFKGIIARDQKAGKEETITFYCTEDLKGLAGDWMKEYQQQFPDAVMELKVGPVQDFPEKMTFVTGENLGQSTSWKMVVGRKTIVPVIHPENAYLGTLQRNGVSHEQLKSLFDGSGRMIWGTLLRTRETQPIHIYLVNDPLVLQALKNYLKTDEIPDGVTMVRNDEELTASVRNDPAALGLCSVSSLFNPGTAEFSGILSLLPIDKNGNGSLDYMENIYGDAESFLRGIWIGKYPGALTRDVFVVSGQPPADQASIAFISWILSHGQEALALHGFNGLIYSEIQSKLDHLKDAGTAEMEAEAGIPVWKLIVLGIAGLVFLGIVLLGFIGFKKEKPLESIARQSGIQGSFSERTIQAPAGLFYGKSHTWAFMEKDGTVRIGIDDFLQHLTGPITGVEIMKPGKKVKKGEALLTLIQKGKKLVLYAPVSGTILETNRVLSSSTAAIHQSPYAEGWICRVEPASWMQEIPMLSMAGKYSGWIAEEFVRFRDFLAASVKTHKLEYASVVLQDGGELKENILEEFGPEVWEDFQSQFIDTGK